jgi:hypothetical protein
MHSKIRKRRVPPAVVWWDLHKRNESTSNAGPSSGYPSCPYCSRCYDPRCAALSEPLPAYPSTERLVFIGRQKVLLQSPPFHIPHPVACACSHTPTPAPDSTGVDSDAGSAFMTEALTPPEEAEVTVIRLNGTQYLYDPSTAGERRCLNPPITGGAVVHGGNSAGAFHYPQNLTLPSLSPTLYLNDLFVCSPLHFIPPLHRPLRLRTVEQHPGSAASRDVQQRHANVDLAASRSHSRRGWCRQSHSWR